ncbi:MAG TPA: 1,2-phenylacetyl-CoA epoxidase subunit PaaD [Phnomibacter sp.]|nr:1,2-phenylacetyl-CoA epoxidase subunit PaaD [Phnomibacter sp.]
MVVAINISLATVQEILDHVVDPEIPVVTIAEMGILRTVHAIQDETGMLFEIVITPTYSGCPAMDMIATQIRMAMLENDIKNFRIKTVLSPAWTTDWMSDVAKEKLRSYGIAPPVGNSTDAASQLPVHICCPQCGSTQTELVSAFSSTACKALYTCKQCLEPFDYFKCH